MAFDAKEYNIYNLFQSNLLLIPRNQRKYVWDRVNWEDLLTDIEFIVDNSKQQSHFLGSVVLRKEDSVNGIDKFNIIDGQQRTITILIFLLALIKIFKEEDMQADVEGTIPYIYIKDRKSNECFVLHSEYHVGLKDMADAIINDTEKTPLNKIVKKICISKKNKKFKEALEFFYQKLKEILEKSGKDKLLNIRDSLLDSKYIRINTDTDEDAYTVFEILNARGQNLEDYELLKNYIMRYISPKEKVDEVKEKWVDIEECLDTQIKSFFRHYIIHIVGSSCTSEIYRTIQKTFPKDKVLELLNDIYRKAHLYKIIIDPTIERDSEEYRILSYLNSKRSVQLRPLLLSLLSAYESELIDRSDYICALQFLQNFYICFTIISTQKSNKLTEIITKYSKLIEHEPSKKILMEFTESLKSKLPTFETFERAFQEIGYSKHYDYYKDSNKKAQVLAALEIIELHLSPNFYSSDKTIEHILPDSESKDNVTIGNLTLLESSLNNNCKNKPLKEKFEIYSQSNFRMTRNVSLRYKDKPDKFNAKSRAHRLAEMIYKEIFKFNV